MAQGNFPQPEGNQNDAKRFAACRWIAGGLAILLLWAAWTTRPAADEVVRPVSAQRIAVTAHQQVEPLPAVTRPAQPAGPIQLCQSLGPAAPYCIEGIDSTAAGNCAETDWRAMGPIPWQAFGQGEYTGHARLPHVPEYRLRVDDQLELVYRLTRDETTRPYELNVGDVVKIESVADPGLERELIVQPDGSITLKLLGQVRAAGRTVEQMREELDKLYKQYYRSPAITVTPLKVNTKLDDLRQAVNSQFGTGGQVRQARVTPEGTIQLPVVGSIPVQGLSLTELEVELAQRYAVEIEGMEIVPVLVQRAPRFIYVLGEVYTPGRFVMEGPTTVMQAIALAGSWRVGANLRQVVVFRRADDWRLLATMLDVRGALYGKNPGPADEIWLNDMDIVVVPKAPIKVANDVIELVFTRGIYGVVPFNFNVSYSRLSSLQNIAVP